MFSDLNAKLTQLYNEVDHRKSLDIAIETANEVVKILSPSASNLAYGEDALDNAVPASRFPNHKIENWFASHPYFADDRVALKFYENDQVETHFYWLGESATKARIAAGTAITPNWEDSDLNQKDDSYKVGLDFFLAHDTKSLLVVATSKSNLRVLELEGRLSNTQVDIFKTIKGAFDLPNRAQIHQTIWDSLALSEVNKKFYAGIAQHFMELIQHLDSEGYDKEDSKLFASRLLGRLLFVWFLRKKHIINESFGYFDIEGKSSSEYYDERLKRLFFQTLNTPVSDSSREDKDTPYLNGGLFEAHDNDWADRKVSFPTGYFKRLYEHLEQYNFTTDESSPEYEQVAIDPEMLGRVFESLLATQLTETGDQARKAKGAFYTPREIVSYMSRESLRQYLYTKLDNPAWNDGVDKLLDTPDAEWELSHSNSKRNLWGEANRNIVPQMVITALAELKILDPACGSGAYPMGMLQIILKTYERLESRDPHLTKLKIIEENIYGIDIEPMAVEISRLRAWLSIVVDSNKNPSDFKPLPNLDFKFVVANSLIPLSKDFQLGDDKHDKVRSKMQSVIRAYFKETDKQKKASLRSEFTKQSAQIGQTNLFGDESELQKQLNSFKPFDVHSEAIFFDPKLMFGLTSKAPFDLVIGNPPYVQLQKSGGALANLYQDQGYQTFARTGDIYSLFYERGLELTKPGAGLLCYITSNKWMRAGYGDKTRGYFASKNPIKLIDFGGFKVFESATVDTNILLIQNASNKQLLEASHFKNDFKKDESITGYFDTHKTVLSKLSSDTWYIIGSGLEAVRQKIERENEKIQDLPLDINFGIIPGYSKAYIIDGALKNDLIKKDPRNQDIIRPLVRGRDVKPYSLKFQDQYIILVHNGTKNEQRINVEKDYPSIYTYLIQYENKLRSRDRANQGTHWTNLRDCAYLDKMQGEKIIYPDITRGPRFYHDKEGKYLLNDSCFFITINNQHAFNYQYLLGLLHSRAVTVFFKNFYAGGGLGGDGYRYKKPFMNRLPIPKITPANQSVADQLTTLVDQIQSATDETEKKTLSTQIDQLVYQLYNLTPDEISIIEQSL